MAELVSFAVPTESDKTLLVWELSSGPTAEDLHVSRSRVEGKMEKAASRVLPVWPSVFSPSLPKRCSGPSWFLCHHQILFSQGCPQSPNGVRPEAAFSEISSEDYDLLLRTQILQVVLKKLGNSNLVSVRLGTRHKAVKHEALALNSSRCQELANYYFGFNGWSKRIIKLQDLSDLEERENEDIVAPLQKQSLKFFCALEVMLPSYECRSPGVGMAEEPLDKLEEGPLSFLMKRKMTQKLAIQKAMSDAFQKLLIVVLESGKIAVAYKPCEEITDAKTEELRDIIQVGYFSWKQYGQGEEECLSDFSLEEEEFRLPELD